MRPAEPFTVRNQTRGTVLADRAEVAGTSESRRRGLLKHSEMPSGFGLWIAPCEAVHTFWMRFAIDVLFLSRDKRVLKLARSVKPWRIAVCWRAHSVLELGAGAIDYSQTAIGDQLRFQAP